LEKIRFHLDEQVENRPAPIIGELPGYDNVLMAAGHYRNGILLAPPTAEAIKEYILAKKK